MRLKSRGRLFQFVAMSLLLAKDERFRFDFFLVLSSSYLPLCGAAETVHKRTVYVAVSSAKIMGSSALTVLPAIKGTKKIIVLKARISYIR